MSIQQALASTLVSRGLTPKAAAGVIGNAYQESALNPGSVGDGGGGLWGFTSGAISLGSLQSYAQSKGQHWTSPQLQANFLMDHVTPGDIHALNSQPTARAAAAWFMNNWERPYVPTENAARRMDGAEQTFKMIAGNPGQLKQAAQQRAGDTGTTTSSQTVTDPGVTTKTTSGGGLDTKAAVLNALLTPTPINTTTGTPSTNSGLLSKIMANVNSGAYTTPVTNTVSKTGSTSSTLKTVAQGKTKGGASSGAGTPPSMNPSGYINPLKGVTNWERTDQGVDANMPVGTAIRAPGDVKILGIEPGWYNGQPFVYFQFLNGPLKGKVQYVAEQIDNIARVGSVVKEGGTIAKYAASGTGLEYGWATPAGQTLAMATSGYKEGYATNAGKNVRRWLNQHGANAGSGAGLSIGAGADPDDSAAAIAEINRALGRDITTSGTRYYKPKYRG